jgi:c-di-GMP-binding flagellar brake protein YcgR
VRLAARSEQPVPGGQLVDVSATGVLAAFEGGVLPFRLGERCLVSLELTEGVLHLLGVVRRRATGADGRQYLGIEYASMDGADTRRLRTLVERYEAGGT